MKKAVGYIRVSTDEQAREGISLAMQEAKILLYAQTYELELVEIICDEGLSAKSIKGRPGVQRALDMCYAGKVAALVVYKLDRLARNTMESLAIAEKLNGKGVSLQSVTEHLDTHSATRLSRSSSGNLSASGRRRRLTTKRPRAKFSTMPPMGTMRWTATCKRICLSRMAYSTSPGAGMMVRRSGR